MKDGSTVIKEVEVKVNAAFVDESKKKEQVGNKFASILMGKAYQNKTNTSHKIELKNHTLAKVE